MKKRLLIQQWGKVIRSIPQSLFPYEHTYPYSEIHIPNDKKEEVVIFFHKTSGIYPDTIRIDRKQLKLLRKALDYV